MALRLRRGTDAERLLITPLEGELIYVTDTKKLYVGDGTTVGGVPVDTDTVGILDLSTKSISELGDVNIGNDSTNPTSGSVLIYDSTSSEWRSSSLFLNDLADVVTDSSTPADGDVLSFNLASGEWNPASLSLSSLNDININGPVDGEFLRYNAINQEWINVGFSSVSGNITDLADVDNPVPVNNDTLVYNSITSQYEGVQFNLQNLFDVNTAGILNNDILVYNSLSGFFESRSVLSNNIQSADSFTLMVDVFNKTIRAENVISNTFEGDFYGSLFSADSTLLVNGLDGNIPASVISGTITNEINSTGILRGDLQGSVFADDSSLIIDSINNTIYTNSLIANGGNLDISSNITASTNFTISSLENRSVLRLTRSSTTDLTSSNNQLGTILFARDDTINNNVAVGLILGRSNDLVFSHDATGNFTNPNKFFIWSNGQFGIGTFTPTEVLDVRGNGVFSGELSASAFKGSIVADDSSVIVDGINGNITAPGFVQFGSFTKTQRDNNISAQNGMVIYNTTSNKFQGYQNGAWINLDDGIADP